MKTRLDQLTAAQFIDLVCGDKDVLLGRHEIVSPYSVTIAMRNIVMEYRAIADPGGNASYLRRVDTIIRVRLDMALYSMCDNLLLFKQHEKAREILKAVGLSADGWNDKRIESEVHIRLQKSKRAFAEIDEDKDAAEDKEDIRNTFNIMIAAMMAHFKFQIDVTTIMAPVFAHLAARYHSEIKAMKSTIKRY